MSHHEVDKFIGKTMASDFQDIRQAAELLSKMTEEGKGLHDENLVSDIHKIGHFLTSRSHNHFSLEERIGASSSIVEQRPRLEGPLRKLQADYATFDKIIAKIKTRLDAVSLAQPESFDLLASELETYRALLKVHAEKETLFVLDAQNIEIGVGD